MLKRAPGELRLTVADNGQGVDSRRADSGLGGRLVEGFAQQLGGQLKRESGDKGTCGVSDIAFALKPRTIYYWRVGYPAIRRGLI
jgi:two-component sensor histidine kinase